MIAKYIYKNIRWNFNRKPFSRLIGPGTTEKQYLEQLEHIANSYYPLSRAVETTDIEFCLNKLALSHADNVAERAALGYFYEFWAQYVRLRNVFEKKYLIFPSNTDSTRIEQIAELFCKCTQFALSDNAIGNLLDKTRQYVELTEREDRYLEEAIRLYKVKYYCAATAELLCKKTYAEKYLGRFLKPSLLKNEFLPNTKYLRVAYAGGKIAAVVDCLGMSASRLGTKSTHIDTKLFVYANGRNVFDTFMESKFGERIAEFSGYSLTVNVAMQYFVTGNSEIRRCTITNTGKKSRKFTVEIKVRNTALDVKTEYFEMGNAICIASDLFAATAIVHDAEIIKCDGKESRTFQITLESNECYQFEIVSVFADNTPQLAESLSELEQFGTTRCPYLWDNACSRIDSDGMNLFLSSHGHTKLLPPKIMSEQINFSYRLGNADVATFVDNGGNSATLLKGFVFGVGGEGIYAVRHGILSKLNEKQFKLDADKLVYEKPDAVLCIRHEKGKIYQIEYNRPERTLFYFPLERTSKVDFDEATNTFAVSDGLRRYVLHCNGKVESYTVNELECSSDKLRYKLSNRTGTGNCIAITIGRELKPSITLESLEQTPAATPIIRESLVSTYLNYVNEKNVFCLKNFIKRPDSLTLAAICYTNPRFIREFLEKIYEKNETKFFYYDSKGIPHVFFDRLSAPLATVYYLNLVGELPSDWIKKATSELFSDDFEGNDLCIKALALLNASKLANFDRVRCLVEYDRTKKLICEDENLYEYAQAIGAMPLLTPSKARLKELCNKYNIPKSWYYVSQLENLYGLSISAGKLQIQPKVTTENVLEQFALNIAGKRIDTTFAKSSVQCMTLNGQQCYAPFYASSLKKEDNELVVSY